MGGSLSMHTSSRSYKSSSRGLNHSYCICQSQKDSLGHGSSIRANTGTGYRRQSYASLIEYSMVNWTGEGMVGASFTNLQVARSDG